MIKYIWIVPSRDLSLIYQKQITMTTTKKYWLHGSAGENLHFQTYDLNEAKEYANSFNSKATVSILMNGVNAYNGKPCKIFKEVYTNRPL